MAPVFLHPLLTVKEIDRMSAAQRRGEIELQCSLDLQASTTTVKLAAGDWGWNDRRYPYIEGAKERTIYCWSGDTFRPAARYASSLVKLVPTDWGPPTFEIDGIKMLPTAQISPYVDAQRKVALIHPRGKVVLDTCGGLGYFAAWCLREGASHVHSYELNPDVIWLRSVNPWSPPAHPSLTLINTDVALALAGLGDASMDAALHDPPRFGIAGDLYSQRFYDDLSRVLKRRGRLFHYTGSPNKMSGGRDLRSEVSGRLAKAGFRTEKIGDGVVGVKR